MINESPREVKKPPRQVKSQGCLLLAIDVVRYETCDESTLRTRPPFFGEHLQSRLLHYRYLRSTEYMYIALTSSPSTFSPTFLRDDIRIPLHDHPSQRPRTNKHRPREWQSPPRRPENLPLRHEMSKSTNICPHSQLIPAITPLASTSIRQFFLNLHGWILNIVSGVHPYNSG